MRLNRKGFTLVELLAVVVILGIIMTVSIPAVSKWINRGKSESKAAQEKTLLLAGESYAQGNSKVLPKAIGDTKLIKAEDLKKANYLKEDLIDADKKNCMKDSFVRIYKYDKNGYTYTAYLYCEGDVVPNTIEGVQPTISIEFTGDNLEEEIYQDVSSSGFRITINGGEKDGKNLGIDGYTYSISVKYADTGEIVEIFNSGSLNAGGKDKLVIEKSLKEYTNITTLSEFMITVEAYNRDGGYLKETANSKYGDSNGPTCGDIEGQAGEDEWFTTPRTSTISVKCIDEKNGSGCLKEVFTKSWNTEVEDDVITITDNAGNSTDCTVRVHHDWTLPTLVVTAYKRNRDGSKGGRVGRAIADNAHPTATLNSYSGSHNGWLNGSFGYGVYYEIEATDNIHINTGQWFYNSGHIFSSGASNLYSMTAGEPKIFTVDDNKTHEYLSSEGLRRARYELSDIAGQKVVVNITANMDRTNPWCSTSKSNLNTPDGVTVSMSCGDGESGVVCPCTVNAFTATCIADAGLKGSKTYGISDGAGNGGACSVTVTAVSQKSTRTCTGWKSCNSYSHGTCGGEAYCTNLVTGYNANPLCYACGLQSNCCDCDYKPTYGCWGTSSACGCKTYSAWSGWFNASCAGDEYTQCRNLYY